MPLYEYKCDNCGERFETLQRFSDEPIKIHEKCGGTVQRLISTSALQFKGSGWYVNDYAKGGSGGNGPAKAGDSKGGESKSGESKSGDSKSGESSKSESSSSSSDSGTKSESKPAATTTSEK